MQCREVRQLIHSRLDDELSGAREVEFREHLAVCADCRAEWAQYRALIDALRGMAAPVSPPPGFAAGVMERLAGEAVGTGPVMQPTGRGPGRWWGSLSAAWRRGVAVAASVLILLAGSTGFAARYGWLPALTQTHAPSVVADNTDTGGGSAGPKSAPDQNGAARADGKTSAAPGQPDNAKAKDATSKNTDQSGGSTALTGAPADAAGSSGGKAAQQTKGAAADSGRQAGTAAAARSANNAAAAAPQVFLNHPRTIDSTLIKVQVTDLAAARQKLLAAAGGAAGQSFGRQSVDGHTVEILRFVVPAQRAASLEIAASSLGVLLDEQRQSSDISAQFAAALDHYQALLARRDAGGDTADLNAQIDSLAQQLTEWDREAQNQVVVVWLQQ